MTKQRSYTMKTFDMSEVRKALRKNVPQINKLENLVDLKNLELIKVDTKEKIVIIFYEGVASRELYPDVGEKLIEKEVISKDNLINSWTGNRGQDNEYRRVHMSLDFPGYRVQVFLRTYNPNYK